MIAAFKKFAPEIYEGTKEGVDPASYEKLPDISIDYAIMEKAAGIYCFKGNYGWRDMGSFDALRKILKIEGRKYIESCGKIIKVI